MTFEDVRALADKWPGVEDGTSYGTPALKVRGRMLTRLREDEDTLVVPGVGPDERDMLIAARPRTFYVTDHYRDWPYVLMRLSHSDPAQVEPLLFRQWQALASKKQLQEWNGAAARSAATRKRAASKRRPREAM
jgi:hypothetical protein